MVKNYKIVKGNQYLSENWLSRKEMLCTADYHNYMCHIGLCAKEFQIRTLIKQLFTKYQFFKK